MTISTLAAIILQLLRTINILSLLQSGDKRLIKFPTIDTLVKAAAMTSSYLDSHPVLKINLYYYKNL